MCDTMKYLKKQNRSSTVSDQNISIVHSSMIQCGWTITGDQNTLHFSSTPADIHSNTHVHMVGLFLVYIYKKKSPQQDT